MERAQFHAGLRRDRKDRSERRHMPVENAGAMYRSYTPSYSHFPERKGSDRRSYNRDHSDCIRHACKAANDREFYREGLSTAHIVEPPHRNVWYKEVLRASG